MRILVGSPVFSQLRPIDIFAAARRLDGIARRTRLHRSDALSARAGGDVYLKREDEQLTGSFKLRGAFNAIASLPTVERARGVVASSAGNHGLGVAYSAQYFGIPARIFVPAHAPEVKKRGIAEFGATVDDSQPDYDAAMSAAKTYGAEHGIRYINPCLGDALLAGQGTVALEILSELPDVATVVVCVGGAGLLGGVASLVRRVAPHVRLVGAQSERTAAMARSLNAGHIVEIASEDTLADGLAGQIDEDALDIGRHGLDEMVVLSEHEIGSAIAWFAREEAAMVEGAGAVAVAALLHRRVTDLAVPAVAIVSGGNIDASRHARVLREHPGQ